MLISIRKTLSLLEDNKEVAPFRQFNSAPSTSITTIHFFLLINEEAMLSNVDIGTKVEPFCPAQPFINEAPVLAPYIGKIPGLSLKATGNI